jgi:hypothetical protein
MRDDSGARLGDFLDLAGVGAWTARMAELGRRSAEGVYRGRAVQQRHALELTLERLRRSPAARRPSVAEQRVLALAVELAAIHRSLGPAGRRRLAAELQRALTGDGTLIGLLHLVRTAALQRSRGFEVRFAGLEDDAPFDLLLSRDDIEAEVVCDVVSAEEGREVHRCAWVGLMDRVDPDLQAWLAAHPGRYLLKLTLPQGLRKESAGQDRLAALHGRILAMLMTRSRADHDETAVLRLDPLALAAAQANDLGLISWLRREFGHEAHLAVTAAGGGVFVTAARAGRENEVAVAIRRRMAAIAPERLSGRRAGILAMHVEDTDRAEWRYLRDQLELEGEARQFLTLAAARCVVAVTCASRFELFGAAAPDGAADGELRFRNPAHPAARAAALAPAVLSSI